MSGGDIWIGLVLLFGKFRAPLRGLVMEVDLILCFSVIRKNFLFVKRAAAKHSLGNPSLAEGSPKRSCPPAPSHWAGGDYRAD